MNSHKRQFSEVSTLIKSGQISDLEELFREVPKTQIAKALDLNATSFSNIKSNRPESFKLGEIITLSKFLNVSLESLIPIFEKSINSLQNRN